MKSELKLVAEFHEKFGYLKHKTPTKISKTETEIRYQIMKEEVEEYLADANNGNLPNLAKELCDILYTTYGTIVAHGLQDVISDVFAEVHRSNMSKETGKIKAVKGPDYLEADIDKYFCQK